MNAAQLLRVDALKATMCSAPYGSVEVLDAVEELMGLVPIAELDVVLDSMEVC